MNNNRSRDDNELIAGMNQFPHTIPIEGQQRNISSADAEYGSRSRSQLPPGSHGYLPSRVRRFLDTIQERRTTNPELERESRAFPHLLQQLRPNRPNILRNRVALSFAYIAGFVPRIRNRNRERERSNDGGAEEREPKRKKNEEEDNIKIHHLCPCPEPSDPGTSEFILLFKTNIVDWCWSYMVNNGQFNEYSQTERDALDNITDPVKIIEKKYEIISTSHLSNNERNEIRNSGKDKKQFLVSDILAIHLAPDQCINADAATKKYATKSWVENLPFPIGSHGMPTKLDMKKSLEQFFDCPNIFLAFYLIHMIRSFQNDNLKAFTPSGGRAEFGPHWLNKCDFGSREPGRSFKVYGVGEVITVNRLSGLAHSVLNGYHTTISGGDPNETSFKRGGGWRTKKGKVKYGKDFMLNDLHTCHLVCDRSEVLEGGTGAHFCLSVGHVCCADGRAVNNSAHKKCDGNVVCISRDGDDEVRSLISFCNCWQEPGNPSCARCGHTRYVEIPSGALAIEKVTGGVHSYTLQQPIATNHGADSESFAISNVISDDDGENTEGDTGGKDDDDESLHDQNYIPTHGLIDDETSAIDLAKFYLVIIDTETTNLLVSISRILEIAFSSLVERMTYSSFLNPPEDFEISDGAFEINGISKVKLIGKDDTEKGLTKFFHALKEVSGKRKLCLVGHNIARFDIPILEKELQRYESCREIRSYLDSIYVIDTLTIAKDKDTWDTLNLDIPASKKLADLHEYLFDKELVDSHSAMGDCLGNAQVLLKMDPTLKIARKHMKQWKEASAEIVDEDEEAEEE
mmetsp:Transcript_35853/g.73212  ORF Transcript_35853/g.73212 Transcript_35853/m.73212 type:complete len:800 (+) Transcript_35853:130-2529(+)